MIYAQSAKIPVTSNAKLYPLLQPPPPEPPKVFVVPLLPPEAEGLTFTVKYTDGDTKTVSATAEEDWGSEAGEQTAVFSYTEGGVTVTAENEATVVLDVPASLAVSGDWTNEQKVSTTVDPTGLTFTATYLSGKTADVTADVTVSPASWGETAGEQTATFSYTEGDVTVTVDKAATVAE